MKRRELILDFTSLLDVILIILFLVVMGMDQNLFAARQEAEDARSAAETQLQTAQQAHAEEVEELRAELEALQDEYDYLKITSEYDVDDLSVYAAAMERMSRVVLICETAAAEDGTQQVLVDIYRDNGGERERSYAGSLTLLHDFTLSKEERQRVNAAQAVEVTKTLSELFSSAEQEIVWFSVQYAYDDVNFSRSDLEIFRSAAENLERSFGKSCYIEEIRLY